MVRSRERHSYGARGWLSGLPPVRSLNFRPYSGLSLRLSPSSRSVKVRKLNVISTAAKRIPGLCCQPFAYLRSDLYWRISWLQRLLALSILWIKSDHVLITAVRFLDREQPVGRIAPLK